MHQNRTSPPGPPTPPGHPPHLAVHGDDVRKTGPDAGKKISEISPSDPPPSKSYVPETKVAVGGFAGALGVLFIGLLEHFAETDIPTPYEGAIYTVVFFVVQYFVPNRES